MSDIHNINDYGCAVQVVEGSLQAAALNDDGSIDEWVDVCAPECQDFLDQVNSIYSTSFQIDQFAGR